ncbi:hypothetical protein ARAM_001261 [Aspergillus rambellii]|uniref:Uncharacterized protein n=1 Tax=Aspergillus rambellii TaxID=308745 RepID=A0A0F8XCE6_9EURO|nr:hypothetical protein ARAM_001261 [Aspergillus rambellii]
MIAANLSSYGHTSLLEGDSPELVLVQATPKERIASIKLNSTEWKGPLDLDTYITREDTLLQQRLTKDAVTCWVLVDRREPEDERTILGSCETYKKKAIVARGGKLEDVSAHGVGSVYCRPDFRGKGYAKRMLEELSRTIDTWQVATERSESSLFSILFSDIGKRFYAQFGWKPYPSSHFELPPISKDEYASKIPGAALPEIKILQAADVQRHLCNEHVVQKEREILRLASQSSPGPKVAIAPDFDHFVWHWAREEFCYRNLYPNREPPIIKGAGDSETGVFCAWNRTFGETPQDNTLYILRWVYDEPVSSEESEKLVKAMAAILRRAQLEAHAWNMANVTFWNPTALLEKAVALLDPAAEIVHREKSSIACLRWNGADEVSEHVEWFWNEKYAWC